MEIEAKLGVPDAAVMRRLVKVRTLAGFDLRPSGASHVRDTYVDTRQSLLRSAGLVCRRRVTAGGLQYTVKALEATSGAVHRREEFEVRLSADAPPARWPRSRARRTVLVIVGKEPLEPIAELEQRRWKRTVLAGRRLVAEMSLDLVRVAVRGGEHTFHEFEIELRRAGTELDLTTMVEALKEEWGLVDVSGSKLTRALAIVDGMDPLRPGATGVPRFGQHQNGMGETTRRRKPAIPAPAEAGKTSARRDRPPRRGAAGAPTAVAPAEQARPVLPRLDRPGLHPTTTMAEAARRTLAVHFGRMLDHEPGTRLGEDREELHDMRVATRRMRAAQRLFAVHIERKVMKPFRKGLRRTGRMLGALRDLDVFHEKTLRYLEGLPEERRGELGPLLKLLGRTRDAAREELLAYLDGEEYRVFCESFAEFLSAPGAGAAAVVGHDGEPLPHEVRHVVPAELYRHYGEVAGVRRAARSAGAAASPLPPAPDHRQGAPVHARVLRRGAGP